MKNMLVRTLTVGMIVSICISLGACGSKDSATENKESLSDEKADEVDNGSDDALNEEESVVKHYESEEITRYYEESGEESYTEVYSLDLYEDGRAILWDRFIYSEYAENLEKLTGSAEIIDDKIVFSYGVENPTVENVYIDGNTITDIAVVDTDQGALEITGTYSGKSEKYGDMELNINPNGAIELETNKGKYAGYVYNYDGQWEMYADNNEYAESYEDNEVLDWMLDIASDTFTYVTYAEYMYGKYEGSYTMVGDLGELTFNVDGEGLVTTSVIIDGVRYDFTGNITVDTEQDSIIAMYLSSEEGHELSLEIGMIGDEYNYFGKFSRSLGAG